MKTQNNFWWFVCVAIAAITIALCTIGLLFWQQLTIEQKDLLHTIANDHFVYVFTAAVLLFAAFGFGLDWVLRFYIIPVNQLAEQTDLLSSINPDLKIHVDGSYDVMRLADIINRSFAEKAPSGEHVQTQLQLIRSTSETERNIMGSLLEDLPQAIMACNLEGNIVLYNRKARDLLVHHEIMPCVEEASGPHNWIGLGRSVFSFIDQTIIMAALARIGRKLAEDEATVHERFLVETRSRVLLPAELIPVLDSQHHLSGFILYIEDQTARLQEQRQLSDKLQSWKHQLIQAVSVIKSSAEIFADNADTALSRDHRHLVRLMAEKADLAAVLLSRNDITGLWSGRPLPLTPIDAVEWVAYLAHRASETIHVRLAVEPNPMKNLISIDMHHLTSGLLYILARIRRAADVSLLRGRLYANQNWVYLDFIWEGAPIDNDTLARWTQGLPRIDGIELNIALREILEVHDAKLWTIVADLPDGCAGLRLLIPTLEDAQVMDINGRTTVLPDSRPEFYDFDLFKNAGQNPHLEEKPLKELIYTIFDTETTGLDPQAGDEIISIGAVRVVNGRLLRSETFEQLINPRRQLPWASIKFHGIRPEMLTDQPFIEEVLPHFFQFARETVLVGHNVAFDMRMLQMKEDQTRIQFLNPLLDTMLLSDIVHPAHQKHSLSAVADRLGVRIMGRHTALGDALATAEIFIKLLPLLNAQGIHSLKEAIKGSRKSRYAHLKY